MAGFRLHVGIRFSSVKSDQRSSAPHMNSPSVRTVVVLTDFPPAVADVVGAAATDAPAGSEVGAVLETGVEEPDAAGEPLEGDSPGGWVPVLA